MNLKAIKHIHFTGIKGVGMTSLALCSQDAGIKVTGSDVEEVFVTDEILKKRDIRWNVGFSSKNLLSKPDLVITTGAHGGFSNPEVVEAKKLGIPVIPQGEAYNLFAKDKEMICVCGVGGKTTTAAMIATILDKVGGHPSFAIGVGNIPSLGAPGRYDHRGHVFICEADEFAVLPGIDNTPKFMSLNPKIIVVTNIEHDHPDIYPTLEDTKKAFKDFFRKLPAGGLLVANDDNQNIIDLINQFKIDVPLCGYGFKSRGPAWAISNLQFKKEKTKYHISLDGLQDHDITLSVPGKFNVYNATAAFLAAREVWSGVDNQLVAALKDYRGCQRRFEKIGEKNGILVYDDYAHHPTEIKATLEAARQWFPKRRIIAVFQPHTYSRTKALFSEFAKSFKDADIVAFMDIYSSARETTLAGVNSQKLAHETAKYHKNAHYTGNHKTTVEFLTKQAARGDVIITMGAGNIFYIHAELIKQL